MNLHVNILCPGSRLELSFKEGSLYPRVRRLWETIRKPSVKEIHVNKSYRDYGYTELKDLDNQVHSFSILHPKLEN